MVRLLSENVDVIVLAGFFLGGILVLWDDIDAAVTRVGLRRSLARRRRSRRRKAPWQLHLDGLFQLLPVSQRMEPEVFAAVSFAIAFVVMYLTVRSVSGAVCILFAMVSGMVPYGILRLRCEIVRSKVSGEGSKMISLLLSSYRMNGGNISEALEFTAAQIRDIPETAPVLQQMVLRLRESENDEMIFRATKGFADSIGSNWARLVAANIRLAFSEGAGISMALEEILNQLREAEILMEERIRMNNESSRMTVFMIPLTFVITTVMAVKQLDVPLADLIKNQFSDTAATVMFMSMIFLFLFNLAAGELIKNRKLDI